MIGVRKNSGVIRLLMAAALVLFVAACSSSSNNSGIERERDQALETVEELEGTVVDLTGSVEDLMGQLAALQGTDAAQEKIEMLEARIAELEGVEQEVNDAADKAKRASVLALFKGLDPAFNVAGSDDEFSATGFTVAATHGKATKVTPAAAEADGPANNKLAAATGTDVGCSGALVQHCGQCPGHWHQRHRYGRRLYGYRGRQDRPVRGRSMVLV